MPTELPKTCTRKIGDLVVTISERGIRLRAPRKQRGLFLTWAQVAGLGLQNHRYELTAEEWERPLKLLPKLANLPRNFGVQGRGK